MAKEEDNDLEIEVVDDDQPQKVDRKPAENNADLKVEADDPQEDLNPDEALSALKQRLAEERSARLLAERRVKEAEVVTHHLKSERDTSDLQVVESAINQIKTEQRSLRDKLREASVVGDHDTIADITATLSLRASQLVQLESGKARLEQKAKEPPPRVAPEDPVEDLASQLSPRSAEWVRRHPEYVRDPRLNQKMLAAHNIAMADGIPVDSDEYFASVEDTLRIRKPQPKVEDDAMDHSAKEVRTRQSAPPAAPVSRSPAGNPRPNVVRLTREEAQMAADLGMTEKEYAQNKISLVKEGRMK